MRIPSILALALVVSCGSKDTDALDGGPITDGSTTDIGPDSGIHPDATTPDTGVCVPDPDCSACAQDGECCAFSINCQPGSICNSPTENEYDPTQPQICIRVVCMGPGDCTPPKVCTPEHVCREPACQNNNDCTPDLCIGGVCVPAPSVTKCEVTMADGVLRTGATLQLFVLAKDVAGNVVPDAIATWTSDQPNRVSVQNETATGGSEAGMAELSASVGNVACIGSVHLTNYVTQSPNRVRVVAVDARLGSPLQGAQVFLTSGTSSVSGVTDTSGVFETALQGIDAVTVSMSGHISVSILDPQTDDVLVALRQVDITRAGGARGKVDISNTQRGDVQLGLVGTAIEQDLLLLGRTPLLGYDQIETVIDAPELGFDQEDVEMSAGMILGLGNKKFTADGTGPRCQGVTVGQPHLETGCYLARGKGGPNAVWNLSGQLRLSQAVAIAHELSQLLNGEDVVDELLPTMLPLIPHLSHGAHVSLHVVEADRVPESSPVDCTNPQLANYLKQCVPNFAAYHHVDLVADQTQRILSTVTIPSLPQLGGLCAEQVTLLPAVNLGARGVVPLGIAGGTDISSDTEPPDCVVNGAVLPFGENSPDLLDGQIPLHAAPRHDGLEGHPMMLILAAKRGGDGFRRSVVIERHTSFPIQMTMLGPFPLEPNGRIDTQAATVTLDDTSGTFARIELYGASRGWHIYAPMATSITLPDHDGLRAILTNLGSALLTRAEANTTFTDIVDLGTPQRLDLSASYLDGFAVQSCAATGSGCIIQ